MKAIASPDAPELNRRFGKALRELRERAGFTQAALARSIGLERTSITNIESGMQTVTIPTLVKICRTLGISPAQLVPADVNKTAVSLASISGQYATVARKILRKRKVDATS